MTSVLRINPLQVDIEDIGNRVLDISEDLALEGLRDDLEDIEVKLEFEIERLERVKQQVRRMIPQLKLIAETTGRELPQKPFVAK